MSYNTQMGQLKRQLFSGKDSEMSRAGCTCKQFRQHIESQFKDGMHWGNYGDWEIDHITPCSFFQGADEASMNHFSNLQPLWHLENIIKSDRMGKHSARILIALKNIFCSPTHLPFHNVLPVSSSSPLPMPRTPFELKEVFVCGGFLPQMVTKFECGGFLVEETK